MEIEYLALNVAATVDLDAFKTLSLQRQTEIDAACGVDFASRFAEEFRHRPLFVNPLAPGPELLRDLANWTFAKLALPYTLTRDWRPTGRGPETPLHPSLVGHFGLGWAAGRRGRLLTGEAVDFAEYVRRYLSYAEGPELEMGVATLALGDAEAALTLLEKAAARPMGRRCQSARRALTSGFLAADRSGEIGAALRRAGAPQDEALHPAAEACAAGRWSEAEAALLDLLKQRPGAVELHDALAQVRERRRDPAGRVAALRDAAALRPGDAHAQSRLTRGARRRRRFRWRHRLGRSRDRPRPRQSARPGVPGEPAGAHRRGRAGAAASRTRAADRRREAGIRRACAPSWRSARPP